MAMVQRGMRMTHAVDPKKVLFDAVGSLDGLEVMHNQVLAAIYQRPTKTAGGIILTDNTRQEDVWQGKIALVLKKGPMAFKDDPDNGVLFAGQNVEPGDWIMFRPSDGFQLLVNSVACRMFQEVHILGRVTDPDAIF